MGARRFVIFEFRPVDARRLVIFEFQPMGARLNSQQLNSLVKQALDFSERMAVVSNFVNRMCWKIEIDDCFCCRGRSVGDCSHF